MKTEAKKAVKKTKKETVKLRPPPLTSQASKAAKSLGFKLAKAAPIGICMRLKHTKKGVAATTPRGRWCRACKKAVRKEQLRLNNIVWKARVKKGTAGHHVAYKGKATGWAVEKTDLATKKVKKGKSIYDLASFRKALEARKAAKLAKKAAKKEKAAKVEKGKITTKLKHVEKTKGKKPQSRKPKGHFAPKKEGKTAPPEPDYA